MTHSNWETMMWMYPWDAQDEGVEPVLSAIQDRAGIDGVGLAVAYHSGMFLLPHNPRRKLYFPQPSIYVEPDQARFRGLTIQPQVNDLAASGVVESVRRESARRGMRMTAWVVALHNTGLGTAHPSATTENAFGDRHLPHLCPANPDVRAYLTALIGDLAARDFDGILVESLEYMPYQHGYHHEVDGLPLTPFASYLLGLCFCEHCLAAASASGVDGAAVRDFARTELEAFFAGELDHGRPDIDWSGIRELANGELGAFHDARIQVVTSLFAEIRATWPREGGPSFEMCDFAPLWPLGWDGTALPSGLDLSAVAPYVDAAWPCPYFTSPEMIAAKTAEYQEKAPDNWPIRPIVRAIPPQVRSQDDLIEQMVAAPASVAGFGFYNYGFMRLTTLDWIRKGIEAARGSQSL